MESTVPSPWLPLGGPGLVTSRVISALTINVNVVTLLVTPLRTAYGPPSKHTFHRSDSLGFLLRSGLPGFPWLMSGAYFNSVVEREFGP